MNEKRVLVPTGFVEILIEVADLVPIRSLTVLPSSVFLYSEDGKFSNKIGLKIGNKQVIPLRPGIYTIVGILGNLESEPVRVEIESGKVDEIIFQFGRTLK